MIQIRRSAERGHFDHGWLEAFHTFSFASYHDPEQMGFSRLRVLNQDRIQPGEGFGTHGHREMEIITYIIEGVLEHRDSMDNGSQIHPGDVQVMSAGTGVTHSEFNGSQEAVCELLQIWIVPARRGTPPSYQQKHFPEEERRGRLRLVVSPDGADGSLTISQDARLYAGLLRPEETCEATLDPRRRAWLHLARGALLLDGERMEGGDGAAISEETALSLEGAAGDGEAKPAEMILIDLP